MAGGGWRWADQTLAPPQLLRTTDAFCGAQAGPGYRAGRGGGGEHKIVKFIHYFLANKKVTLLP